MSLYCACSLNPPLPLLTSIWTTMKFKSSNKTWFIPGNARNVSGIDDTFANHLPATSNSSTLHVYKSTKKVSTVQIIPCWNKAGLFEATSIKAMNTSTLKKHAKGPWYHRQRTTAANSGLSQCRTALFSHERTNCFVCDKRYLERYNGRQHLQLLYYAQ